MARDPGYIKGYLPGIRENGGQYTHAALWVVIALARLGMGDEAMELFHMINPINHTRTRRGRRALQGRAVRRRRRRLRAPDARRPRRLDLVHRLGRLDVSGGGAGAARACGGPARRCSIEPCIPDGVARVLADVARRALAVSLRGRRTPTTCRTASPAPSSTARTSIPRRFRWSTTAREHEVNVLLGSESTMLRTAAAGSRRTSR